MYIYNVTLSIDKSIHNEWLAWIHNHIPEVLATGKFLSAKLTQVLIEEEMDGVTYSVQYTAKTREDLDNYYKEDADRLQAGGMVKFADKMLTFRTELKIVNEFFSNEVSN
jgi:Holliday junction resolvase RusA-like endonuclease